VDLQKGPVRVAEYEKGLTLRKSKAHASRGDVADKALTQ
jgi:hypothetical protein